MPCDDELRPSGSTMRLRRLWLRVHWARRVLTSRPERPIYDLPFMMQLRRTMTMTLTFWTTSSHNGMTTSLCPTPPRMKRSTITQIWPRTVSPT